MRKLLYYPNCSKGGVTSVIRGRAVSEPTTEFDVVFSNDRGGLNAFEDLNNVAPRIVDGGRLSNFLASLVSRIHYDEIHVLSAPKVANQLVEFDNLVVTYEFHSSNMKVVESEIKQLQLDKLYRITVPSPQMHEWISERVPARIHRRIEVVENLVDESTFNKSGTADFFDEVKHSLPNDFIPVTWVGRFDLDKGYHFAIRTLAQLPENYIGVFVVSIEKDPERAAKFFNECDAFGVRDRVQLFMNLSADAMANLYRSASKRGGWFISTSLMESFGYAIAEALMCGLPVAAFDLPVLEVHKNLGRIESAPIGNVKRLAAVMQ